jgi:flagellar biogenesis protein FliO
LGGHLPPPDNAMEALKLLLTTDIGLLSLGAILFMIVMAIYMFTRFRKLMNQEPGKEGWN